MGQTSLVEALACGEGMLAAASTLLPMSSRGSAVVAGLLDVCELSDTELSEGERSRLGVAVIVVAAAAAGDRFLPLPSTRPPPKDLREAMMASVEERRRRGACGVEGGVGVESSEVMKWSVWPLRASRSNACPLRRHPPHLRVAPCRLRNTATAPHHERPLPRDPRWRLADPGLADPQQTRLGRRRRRGECCHVLTTCQSIYVLTIDTKSRLLPGAS